ncbi:exonuclease domain in DNA-polymerase alpha and epsilon chain ribonuclease T and other exonuclease [Aspergillus parasiticus SU-1]|uniref:Exonuclease domain in DNA-polymerase alpha and epsilon chain ribonuclease T and other exonuclease n=1 Tax=Aspergillus parasiticus (strain ATCC 56775 / NRRL 5862 / SRRC 143 / SU-1) TaxID=1403190 RepID=A0A0F0IGU9_ASPPU|nr:exonuclease domain in DNA-polymerase alpha and epsilon chain ribonuclease T and other exonuclease [Aspergillus parasiticus SU-1]
MDRVTRLNLLFGQDEALLRLDTQLRTVPEVQSNRDSVPINDNVNIDREPSTTLSQPVQSLGPSKPATGDEQRENVKEKGSESVASIPGPFTQTIPVDTTPSLSLEGPNVPHDGTFSPLVTISRYAYKYVKGPLSQKLASEFFDGGKFWNRSSTSYGPRHLILVPTTQVRAFFQEINCALQCNFALSEEGLILPLNKEGFPQPIFIGRSTCRETKDRLESQISVSSEAPRPSPGMDEQFTAFEQLIETAWETTRNKKKVSKAKQQQRMQNQQRLVQGLRRVQSYLGLRSSETDDLIDSAAWEEKKAQEPMPETPGPLHLDKPAPFPFWMEPVFICIDVESNEYHHKQITEVGISILDTLDLVGMSPAEDGAHWRAKIQSRHLRVEEYAHHVNQHFVAGCPGNFDFGASEWVSANDLGAAVQNAFQIPSSSSSTHAPRHLILVGHAVSSDVQYLRQIGVRMERKPEGTAGFIGMVDTAEFFRIIRGEPTTRKLADILQEFNMTGWHLHNAGNDARYTMEVMLCMMLEHSR